MSARHLPPLNSLRAFEAAARKLSFSKAAEELNVTPGAISQQIKTLEEFLNIKLFKRQKRQILLTEQAQVCLPYLSEGLDKLSEGIQAIEQLNVEKPLTITVAEAFGARWLMPRLRRFQKLHPDIDVRLDISRKVIDLIHDDIDVGIRFGDGNYPGLETDFLLPQEVYPVCSPGLLKKGAPINTPADLRHQTLIHGDLNNFDPAQPDWAMWFKLAGIEDFDSSHGLHFTNAEMVIQAAVEGQGVALVGSVTVKDGLDSGYLVRLFEHSTLLDNAYYLVYPKSKIKLHRVSSFRNWLLGEAGGEQVNA